MAQLTWREMAAPDLSSSLRGVNQFTEILNQTLQNAKGTVNEIDAGITDRSNNAALRIAMAAQNSDQAKALLASDAIMGNSRLTAPTLNMLGARPGQLIAQATGEQNLADLQYSSKQVRDTDARAPLLMQARAFQQADDAKGYAAFMAANPGLLDGLGYKTASDFTTATQNDLKGAVDITTGRDANKRAWNSDARDQTRLGYEGERLGMDRTRLSFEGRRLSMDEGRYGWEVTDRNDLKTGQAAFLAMSDQSMDKDSALASFSSPQFKGLTPGAKMVALQQLNQTWGNIYTPAELGQMAGYAGTAGGASGANNGSAAGMTYGGGQLPTSIKTVGDLVNNKSNLVKNLGASPVGMYQINADTWADFGPKVLGAGWQNADVRDPAVQDKVARAIWNSTKGNPERIAGRWASISLEQAKGLAGKSWEQVRDTISSGETRSRASSILQGAGSPAGVAAGAQLRLGQDRVGRSSASGLINAAVTGSNNPREVVEGLRSGPFKGTNAAFLTTKINDIVNRSKVNGQPTITPGQAGVILSDALRENNDSWGITNYLQGNSARVNKNGDRINGSYVDNEIARAKTGNLPSEAVRETDVAGGVQIMQAAQQQAQAAAAAYRNALMRSAIQPGIAAQLPRLKAQMDATAAAVSRAASNVEQVAAPVRQPVGNSTGKPTGSGFWGSGGSLLRIRRE